MFPDFNRLKVFYYIFLKKSVAAAAKELHVTQSAVSQHLQKLEAEIKTPLFTRLHKKLVPTAAGEKLFDIMEPFIRELENGIRSIHQSREGPFGVLRVGSAVEFGERYLPGVFASFRERYPDVSFHLELGHPTVLLPLLSSGRLDFAFADIFSKKGEFSRELAIYSIESVISEELIMVCSKGYYESRLGKDSSLGNILKADYLAYQEYAPALKSWFGHHYGTSAIQLNFAMTVESVQGVIFGITANLGLGIVPSHLVRDEIALGEIVHIKTPKKEMINRISLVQLQDKVPGRTEKAFTGFFKKEIRETGIFAQKQRN